MDLDVLIGNDNETCQHILIRTDCITMFSVAEHQKFITCTAADLRSSVYGSNSLEVGRVAQLR